MASVQIGAVRVSLGLDSAQFSQGLKSANGGIKAFTIAAAAAFAGVSAAAAKAFGAIRDAADRADDAWKASQSIGIPIRDLGRLSYAAEMSGASFDTLSTGVRKASQGIAQAAAGASNEASKALKSLNVAVRNSDGSLRSVTDVIGDVAERFSKMPDGVAKTNAAIAIFGRSGASLIPTLNMGRDGLKAMGDEAERMGLVFDEKTARSAESFNDNLMRLSLSFTGLWNRVLAGVIPAFEGLSNKIVGAVQNGRVLDVVIGSITIAMNVLTKGIGFVVDNLDFLIDLFKVWVGARIVLFLGAVGGSMINMAKAIKTAGLAMALITSITRAKITALALLGAVIAKVTGLYEPFVAAVQTMGKTVMESLPESVRSGIDGALSGLRDLALGIETTDSALTKSFSDMNRAADLAVNSFGSATRGATAVGQAIRGTDQATKAWGETITTVSNSISGALSGVVKDAIRGTDAMGGLIDKVGQLGDSLIDMAFNQMIQGVLGSLFGGGGFGIGPNRYAGAGGFFPGLTGPNLLSFEGGGDTGSGARVGGLDGRGGFLAMLHPDETVSDHRRGGGSRGDIIFNVDARYAQRGAGGEIVREFRKALPNMLRDIDRRGE